jgi:hypothetical protein
MRILSVGEKEKRRRESNHLYLGKKRYVVRIARQLSLGLQVFPAG